MFYEIFKIHTGSRSKIETLELTPELALHCRFLTPDEQ